MQKIHMLSAPLLNVRQMPQISLEQRVTAIGRMNAR